MVYKTVFNFVNRGKQKWLILIPGWATDYRIFSKLNLEFNYIIPVSFFPVDFKDNLLKQIKKNNISSVSILGVSLGGFLAAEFCIEFLDLIDEVILIGIRKQYPLDGLKIVENLLNRNKKAYLTKFYEQCFLINQPIPIQNLLNDYCENIELDYLLLTLDYLKTATINITKMALVKNIKIIHGQEDRIAPIAEAENIANALPNCKFIVISQSGHFPFLNKDFNV